MARPLSTLLAIDAGVIHEHKIPTSTCSLPACPHFARSCQHLWPNPRSAVRDSATGHIEVGRTFRARPGKMALVRLTEV